MSVENPWEHPNFNDPEEELTDRLRLYGQHTVALLNNLSPPSFFNLPIINQHGALKEITDTVDEILDEEKDGPVLVDCIGYYPVPDDLQAIQLSDLYCNPFNLPPLTQRPLSGVLANSCFAELIQDPTRHFTKSQDFFQDTGGSPCIQLRSCDQPLSYFVPLCNLVAVTPVPPQ